MRHLAWALALVAGCGIENTFADEVRPEFRSNPPTPPATTVTDEILQVTEPIVDVLWVIDDSCSMDDDQHGLVSNYDAFLEYFRGSGLDWRIGVVSTDLNDAGRLETRSGHKWIEEGTSNPLQVFGQMALLGTTGSGCEKGLAQSFTALETQPYNDGFVREDAALHTIVISDEPDQSDGVPISHDEYVAWYRGLKEGHDERTFSAIAALDPRADCSLMPVDYHDVVDEIGGIHWDIRQPGWRQVLDLLGVQAAGLRREYFLSQRPVAESLEVHVETPDGVTLAFEPGEDWVYDESRNSIRFQDFVPGALSRVSITYEVLSGAR